MSHMKRLAQAIGNYCEEDEEAREEMSLEINQYVHDEITFDNLSEGAKYVWMEWEQEECEMSLPPTRFVLGW